MKLSKKLVTEFVKVTNTTEKTKAETTVYGTIVKNGDSTYAQLDGSDVLTPVSTTTDTQDGDRVTVLIKNHTATVTGNITSPAARTDDVQQIGGDVASITEENLTLSGKLTAAQADIENLKTDKLSANEAQLTYATITNLDAANAEIDNLEATHAAFETATAQNFEAMDAKINNLVVGELEAVYANIDFSNIGEAAMEYLYSQSGLIENVVVSDGTITGNLVGVTIKGDLIEGNTVVADKLVIKGQNGLYYKLNTDGESIETEQTEYNSLNGSIITAKSITATKISVDDLVAFDATIGGFTITDSEIYSGVKESVGNTTRGIYLGKDGQMSVGDSQNFFKYYKDTDGSYKLEVALNGTSLDGSIDDASKTATNFLGYDEINGLQLGNRSSGAWSGFRTQTTSSAFNILDSLGSILASYGAKLIELGKNATDAVIRLCGGKGQIEYASSDDTSDNYLQISAEKLRLKSESMTSVYSSSTNSSGEIEKSAVNVSPNEVYIYSGSSSVTTTPETMSVSTPGKLTINSTSIEDSYGQFISVVEGSSGIWSYKKWSNGSVELWGTYTVSGLGCTTKLGDAMYRTDAISMTAFPFSIYTPNLTASYESDGYGGILWATSTTTQQGPPSYYLLRPTSATIVSGKINFHVFGKWTM